MKRQSDNTTKKKMPQIEPVQLLPVIMLVVTFFVYAPISLYNSNISVIGLEWRPVLSTIAIVSTMAFLVLLLPCLLLKKHAKCLYSCLVFGVSLALYIQGVYLVTNIGIMNGQAIEWANYKNYLIRDTIVWSACCIAPVLLWLLTRKTKPAFWKQATVLLSCLIIAAQLISLIALLAIGYRNSNGNPKSVTNADLFVVGEEKNALVFVLDMFDQEYFDILLKNNPEIVDSLNGFTYFDNCTGSYSTTLYSIPTILTGQFATDMTVPIKQYIDDAFTNTDLYKDMLRAGYLVDLYTDGNMYLADSVKPLLNNYRSTDLVKIHYLDLAKRIYQFVGCRYFPQALKPYVWLDGTEFSRIKTSVVGFEMFDIKKNRDSFFDALKHNGLSIDTKSRFKFYHLWWTHFPYHFDETGVYDENSQTTALQAAMGSLTVLDDYFEQLRKLGLYNDALIIVVADHGYYRSEGSVTNPLLLIKPRGSHGELKTSSQPVSQLDIVPTIAQYAGINVNNKYGISALEKKADGTPDRRFYSYILNDPRKTGPDSEGKMYATEFMFSDITNDPSKAIPTGRLLSENGVLSPFGFNPYAIGKTIMFTYNDHESLKYFDYGLLERSDTKTIWLQNKQACISMTMPEYNGQDLYCELVLGPSIMGTQQRIRVCHNEVELCSATLTQNEEATTLQFLIPSKYIEGTQLVLRIETPDAYPYSIGAGQYLSTTIKSIVLKTVE